MISFETSGSFKQTDAFLAKMESGTIYDSLERYAQMGLMALQMYTPVESGITASSWSYEITRGRDEYSIAWINTAVAGRTPLILFLQYGHGTGTGGYVPPVDIINPALQPIFDDLAENVWKAVVSA